MNARVEQILNLLVDEIEERMQKRQQAAAAISRPAPGAPLSEAEARPPVAAPVPPPEPRIPLPPIAERHPLEPEPEPEPPPVLAAPSHAARAMGRLALGLLVAVIAINIPFTRHGTTLATAMPDRASLVIRNGLVVKEEDAPEIYVYQDGKFRWISSLDAFEHYGYTWEDVHIVEDGWLDDFETGTPIHVLLKCPDSPHIYRLENGEKRWIRDVETFTAEGHVWEDVRFVSCEYLRSLPDGETIPPGVGPPPQP